MNEPKRRIFGIDLGATYSAAGYIDEAGRAAVTRNGHGDHVTPSVVYFQSAGNVVVGKLAMESFLLHPDRVVSHIKMELGDREWRWSIYGVEYTPPSIAAIILGTLARDAEMDTGRKATDVMIAVPVYFGEREKKATRRAGEIAGLNVIGLVPDPVAAAMHYGITDSAEGETFLVYDLGGASFDVSIIRVANQSIEVLAVGGDHMLGGRDWDEKLLDYLMEQTIAQCGDDSLHDDEVTVQNLLTLAENTKQDLSVTKMKTVVVRYAGTAAKITVTRSQFEQMTEGLLEMTIRITESTLASAEEKYPEIRHRIKEVLLVGGAAKMPMVAERVAEAFGLQLRLNEPDLAVAKGAALYASKDESSSQPFGSLVEVAETAVVSSALLPFVQALAEKAVDDVYSSLRRLGVRMHLREKYFSPNAALVISVADELTRLVLDLPASLGDADQATLHRLLESLTHRNPDAGAEWLRIRRASGDGGWNARLVTEIPDDSIILESISPSTSTPSDSNEPKSVEEQQFVRIAELERERKILRRMIRYLASEIDPEK